VHCLLLEQLQRYLKSQDTTKTSKACICWSQEPAWLKRYSANKQQTSLEKCKARLPRASFGPHLHMWVWSLTLGVSNHTSTYFTILHAIDVNERASLYKMCDLFYNAISIPIPDWPPLSSSGQSSWLHNGDVLCFLWGTNWIYICCVEESGPPLWSSGQSSWLHNGDVLCFLWGTNWIYVSYVEKSRPPLWSSGQSSWLQNQRSGFDSRRYLIFWRVVGLERGPLSLVSTTEGLLGRKSSCSGLENREYGSRVP
jgi:hypothetical protein